MTIKINLGKHLIENNTNSISQLSKLLLKKKTIKRQIMKTRHSVWRNKFWRLLKPHNFAYGSPNISTENIPRILAIYLRHDHLRLGYVNLCWICCSRFQDVPELKILASNGKFSGAWTTKKYNQCLFVLCNNCCFVNTRFLRVREWLWCYKRTAIQEGLFLDQAYSSVLTKELWICKYVDDLCNCH